MNLNAFRRQYSFTSHATLNPAVPPPGDRLDSEVDRINKALRDIVVWAGVSLNSDGSLRARAVAKSAENDADHAAGMAAVAEDWAAVSHEWAEHMPDTIPPGILADMAITGDHWSSRWWANKAAQLVSQAGNPRFPQVQVANSSTVLSDGFAGLVRVENTSAAPLTVVLPPAPTAGQCVLVKDAVGNAAAFPVTIDSGGSLIEDSPSLVLFYNYSWVELFHTGAQWVQI